jgi:predicted molibdopterin-dependent oxidoreductase YjgC
MVRKSGVLTETSWEEATKTAIDTLRAFKGSEIMVIASSRATNEDNYALLKFANDVLKTSNVDFVRYIDESFGDDFLRVSDKSPNTAGLLALGLKDTKGVTLDKLAENISNGNIKALYVMDEDISDISPELTAALDKLQLLIVHASNHTKTTEKAHVVIASATYAEITGTVTNVNKRVQLIRPAVTTQENARYMGMKMSRLDKMGAFNDRWTHGARRNCRQNWRSLQHIAKLMGTEWNYSSSEHIFDEIAANVAAFKGMGYEVMEAHQGLVLDRGMNPDPKVTEYVSHYYKPE